MHRIALAVALVASAGGGTQGASAGSQDTGELASAAATEVLAPAAAVAAIALHGKGIIFGVTVVVVVVAIGIVAGVGVVAAVVGSGGDIIFSPRLLVNDNHHNDRQDNRN